MFNLKSLKAKDNNNIQEKEYLFSSSLIDHPSKVQKMLKETGNIYVYVGTYEVNNEKNVTNPNDFPTLYDSPNAHYRTYMSIEMPNNERKIAISDQLNFERENIVLYPPKGVNKIEFFNQVSKMYFGMLNEYGQEKAIEKILEFQGCHKEKNISLEDLIQHINSGDEEDFEISMPPFSQKLKLSNNKRV